MRGKEKSAIFMSISVGITPAYAGKSLIAPFVLSVS